jgi:heme exporter protein D
MGLISYIFQYKTVAFCIWAASGIVFAVLLVLLAIEAHQDNVLNEIAIKENRKNDK